MKQIIDIKGYWSLVENHCFKDTDIIEGSIIVNPDGWFEGITKDLNKKTDSFVFGVLTEGKKIVLYKFTNNDISPHFYLSGECLVTGYDGKFEIIGVIQPLSSGVCHIDAIYPEYSNKYEAISNLEEKIKEYKKNIIGSICMILYDNFKMAHYRINGYYDESYDIIDDYNVANNQIDFTMEESMRLVREKKHTEYSYWKKWIQN